MPPPQATEQLYKTIQRYELMMVVIGRRLWRRMLPNAMDQSWQQIRPQLTAVTAGAQLAAAQAGVDYVPNVLEEQGIPDRPEARIRPQAFSGIASDGRSLPGLLDGAVVRAKRSVLIGKDGGDALLDGQRWLEQALRSAVADAVRDATTASIIARPNVGWVRVVNPPCCSRCAILAGKFYAWNEPLLRHPQCDCLNQPTSRDEADQYFMDTRKLYEGGFITDLSGKQRAALDGGADMSKVLNQSRDRWRERMAADRRAAGPVDRAGRSRPIGYNGGGTNPAPVGTTVHDFMARLTSRVEALDAMKTAGIAT
jgi:hypothetical protein